MPIYDFKCETCDSIVEKIVESSEVMEIVCSECNGKMARQLPCTMYFNLKYDPKKDRVSWGNEGYATTRRYEEIDKQAKHNIFDQKVKES